MVASVRGVNLRGVTIGQNIAPPVPTGFLDTFTGAAVLLTSHTPDIGNAWTWPNSTDSTASTTGSGSAISNNENGGQPTDSAEYRSALTHTGTDFELKCFVDTNIVSTDQNIFVSAFKGSSFEIFYALFTASTSSGGESGTTTSRSFQVFINNVEAYSYAENGIGFATGVEYKLVVSGTSAQFFIGGTLIDSGTIPAFTEGPTNIAIGIGHDVSVSSVSLTYI